MQAMASPARRQVRPTSLMERLALVANGERLPVPMNPREGGKQPLRTGAYLGTLLWFGLGALSSGAIGGIAFLGLQALAAGEARVEVDSSAAPVAETVPAKPAPHTFEVAIDRSESARAPFGLHVMGTEEDNVEVVLQGIPAAARLSRGERRGAMTWVVKRADLAGLHLTLGDATPDAFDVRIDVVAPPGMPTVGSLVRVRMVDSASPPVAAGASRLADGQAKTDARITHVAKPAPTDIPATRTSGAAGDEKVARPPPERRAAPAVSKAKVAASPPAPPARRWPEGASALGAIPRNSERQVWWNMPPPSWSPFRPAGMP